MSETPASPHARPRLWPRVGAAAAVAVVLGGVFVLYRQPDFLVMLGNMIWACFG
ncbi:hypothetical protein [Xenophilus sp.]|jgi:hypothetical protein|uniref:hypothetical protein n=1 Tax=Xenophilus sp. TaxID=1873499 RepID=UPI0037DD4E3A